MLLNNLTQFECVTALLSPMQPAPPPLASGKAAVHPATRIDNLIHVFTKMPHSYNAHASFDYLAGVFANLSARHGMHPYWLGPSTIDGANRLETLLVFLDDVARLQQQSETDGAPPLGVNPALRRTGIISVVKHVCMGVAESRDAGMWAALLDDSLNLVIRTVLPLAAPQDYADEVMCHLLRYC
jgi:hypothetical protein